jgi:hypothetical protein
MINSKMLDSKKCEDDKSSWRERPVGVRSCWFVAEQAGQSEGRAFASRFASIRSRQDLVSGRMALS